MKCIFLILVSLAVPAVASLPDEPVLILQPGDRAPFAGALIPEYSEDIGIYEKIKRDLIACQNREENISRASEVGKVLFAIVAVLMVWAIFIVILAITARAFKRH